MKHKLKKILLLYIISGTLFVSCSLEEDYATKKRYEEKMKISHVSFGELLKNKKFSTAYSKVLQQQSLTNKTVMEEQYQFTIANKPVKVIETESATSYTILINRAIDDVNSFENLIVQQFNSGETTANIIKYVPFQPATIESYFLNGDFNGNRTITPIVYNDNLINSTNKITNICSTVCTTLCYDCKPNYSSEYQIPHPPQNGCPTKSISTSCDQVCVTYDDGGGSSSNPIDITGGGGTGGTGDLDTPHNDSGNNNPIVTAPVLELEEEEAPKKTPCEELKKLINNIECKDAISNLEGHLSEDKEYGFAYEALPNSSDLDELHPIESLPDEPLKLQMGNYIGGNFIGANHLHPRPSTSGAVPMFAADDVAWLFKVAKAHLPDIPLSQKDFSVYFLTLTVGSGTYAIKIKDGLKFYTFMMRTSYKEFKESLEDKFIELGVMASASTLKREFLKILNKNVDSGIGLYQLKEDKTDWEELVFNPLYPNSDPVIKPCNAK